MEFGRLIPHLFAAKMDQALVALCFALGMDDFLYSAGLTMFAVNRY